MRRKEKLLSLVLVVIVVGGAAVLLMLGRHAAESPDSSAASPQRSLAAGDMTRGDNAATQMRGVSSEAESEVSSRSNAAITDEPGKSNGQARDEDRGLRHIDATLEHLTSQEGTRGYMPDFDVDDPRYNPDGVTLDHDEIEELKRLAHTWNVRIRDLKVQHAIETYEAARNSILSGRYEIVGKEDLDVASLRNDDPQATLMVLPGEGGRAKRVVRLTPATHPQAYALLDSIYQLVNERNKFVRGYYESRKR